MFWLNSERMNFVVIGIVAVMVVGIASVKADFTFGEPVNIGPPVNTEIDDDAPFISADSLSLYFVRCPEPEDDPWNLDIWMTTRATTVDPWSEPVKLGPTINSPGVEFHPSVTADGLELYFDSDRPGGEGDWDLWVSKRESTDDDWDTPVNLGAPINTPGGIDSSSISPDGLVLMWAAYDRPGGYGFADIWVTRRTTREDPWGPPENLGPTINTENLEGNAVMSADSLVLFFTRRLLVDEPGRFDIWMSKRSSANAEWQTPINLGPPINTANSEYCPSISLDGTTLYFADYPFARPGGNGTADIWQAPIIPIVDLNADGIVDAADLCIIVDNWGTDNSLCDIGPMPWGDGIVDVEDLIVIAEHLFEEVPPTK